MPQADIDGPQRKILRSEVRPLKASLGETGISLRNGVTLPFVVRRGWNAPAGYYPEAWYVVDPSTREVVHAAPEQIRLIHGLPTITDVEDVVREPLRLKPGKYLVVFSLGAMKGGELEIEVFDAPEEEAA